MEDCRKCGELSSVQLIGYVPIDQQTKQEAGEIHLCSGCWSKFLKWSQDKEG